MLINREMKKTHRDSLEREQINPEHLENERWKRRMAEGGMNDGIQGRRRWNGSSKGVDERERKRGGEEEMDGMSDMRMRDMKKKKPRKTPEWINYLMLEILETRQAEIVWIKGRERWGNDEGDLTDYF